MTWIRDKEIKARQQKIQESTLLLILKSSLIKTNKCVHSHYRFSVHSSPDRQLKRDTAGTEKQSGLEASRGSLAVLKLFSLSKDITL